MLSKCSQNQTRQTSRRQCHDLFYLLCFLSWRTLTFITGFIQNSIFGFYFSVNDKILSCSIELKIDFFLCFPCKTNIQANQITKHSYHQIPFGSLWLQRKNCNFDSFKLRFVPLQHSFRQWIPRQAESVIYQFFHHAEITCRNVIMKHVIVSSASFLSTLAPLLYLSPEISCDLQNARWKTTEKSIVRFRL